MNSTNILQLSVLTPQKVTVAEIKVKDGQTPSSSETISFWNSIKTTWLSRYFINSRKLPISSPLARLSELLLLSLPFYNYDAWLFVHDHLEFSLYLKRIMFSILPMKDYFKICIWGLKKGIYGIWLVKGYIWNLSSRFLPCFQYTTLLLLHHCVHFNFCNLEAEWNGASKEDAKLSLIKVSYRQIKKYWTIHLIYTLHITPNIFSIGYQTGLILPYLLEIVEFSSRDLNFELIYRTETAPDISIKPLQYHT